MWIPRKSSSKKGLVMGILISIFSFVAIHVGFIVVHGLVNEATPLNTISYALDRGLESVELLTAQVLGGSSLIETNVHHASERMEEFEDILSRQNQSGTYLPVTDSLLRDALDSMEESVQKLNAYVGEGTNDLQMFTFALLVESTADDIARRLKNAEEFSPEPERAMISEKRLAMEILAQDSALLTKKFDVEQTIADTIRTKVQKEIAVQRTTKVPPASVGTHVSVCDIECERILDSVSGIWGQPTSCAVAPLLLNTPICSTIIGKECQRSRMEARNVHSCQDR